MNNVKIITDSKTEFIFSLLRWLFLLMATSLFYIEPLASQIELKKEPFPVLLTLGILYMTVSQIGIWQMNKSRKFAQFIMRAGIVFDYIALIWLLLLTGGVHSPLFPISFLFVMHATIYWKLYGAIFSVLVTLVGYTVILFIQGGNVLVDSFNFAINSMFLLIVGVFGALLAYRERSHFHDKLVYRDLMLQDFLTGLQNHRSFQEQLKTKLKNKNSFTLILGDIDFFKEFNDKYGHITGDEVLCRVAAVLSAKAEEEKGVAFRYGGEEFAVLLPKQSDPIIYIESVYKGLYETCDDERFRVTMSFGVVTKQAMDDGEDMLDRVDKLLYEAKRTGRNKALFADGSVKYNSTA
ncbi:GGDEF domain-containing protein [Bacillus sp. HMF5848]|uniref:GGDEF domain-containing protein n=1 Tax=Bacillus sp. HMF5848 TaxID=2495421 RepID=UPI000F7B1A58|nr:GGDEF domain-containing protein [Bacillus sp. HMF5848]RSK26163.1 GGDEF domain-containing protein [Bacillus sp. HMF5848]